MTNEQASEIFQIIRSNLLIRNLIEFHESAQYVAQEREKRDVKLFLVYYLRELIDVIGKHDGSVIDSVIKELNQYVLTTSNQQIKHIVVDLNDMDNPLNDERRINLRSIADFDDLLKTLKVVEYKISDDLNLRNSHRLKL
jgi:hypothetical protein